MAKAWLGINQITQSLSNEHSKLAFVLDNILAELLAAKVRLFVVIAAKGLNLREGLREHKPRHYKICDQRYEESRKTTMSFDKRLYQRWVRSIFQDLICATSNASSTVEEYLFQTEQRVTKCR